VDLVEAGHYLALGRHEEGAVGDLVVAHQHAHRADVQPDRQLAGQRPEVGDGGIALLRPHGGKQAHALHLHQRGDFGRLHVLGALSHRLADEGGGVRHVLVDVAARAHLHEADAEAVVVILRHRAKLSSTVIPAM
jgi:hypothetical protein